MKTHFTDVIKLIYSWQRAASSRERKQNTQPNNIQNFLELKLSDWTQDIHREINEIENSIIVEYHEGTFASPFRLNPIYKLFDIIPDTRCISISVNIIRRFIKKKFCICFNILVKIEEIKFPLALIRHS